MSTVRANNYYDASGGSNAVFSGVASPPNSMGFRNRILNGGMVIDQRNAGASITPATGTYNNYCVDRFPFSTDGGGRITAQQSSTAPATYPNSLFLTVHTADSSIAAGDQYWLEHRIEGNNFSDMAFGSASAQTFTLSFWVRSSVTGTYSVAFRNSAGNRSYVATYTISAANTWEQKVITVAGDTSGTWLTTNGIGIMVMWDLGSGSNFNGTAGSWQGSNLYRTSGSVNWISNAAATFYITGVQLEAGTVASPFERRDYGRELMMCQRYFIRPVNLTFTQFPATRVSANNIAFTVPLPVPLRASPTVTTTGTSQFTLRGGGTNEAFSSPALLFLNDGGVVLNKSGLTATTTGTDGYVVASIDGAGNCVLNISAEL